MKEIAELHIVSMSLFGAAVVFVLINISQLTFRHIDYSNVDKLNGISYSEYFTPKWSNRTQIINIISGASAMFTGSNF
jgi:hypothetical protein